MSLVKIGSLGLLAASIGCASAPKPVAATADPERTILELRAKNAGYVRRIEELENRVFILEDQLDSRSVALEQRAPAMLPKRPAAEATPPAGDDLANAPVQTSLLAEHAVDYAGDAATTGSAPASAEISADGKRPMLRLTASSPPRAPEPRADARTGTVPRPSPDPLKLYRQSLELLRGGHPDVARVGFRRFLDANPQHDYADNALYWIGECDYAVGDLAAAERSFRTVVERYPRGNKVPDAMLKMGFTLQALGDEAGGRTVLESLTRAFPRHEAARLAAARLTRTEPKPVSTAKPADKTLGTIAPGQR